MFFGLSRLYFYIYRLAAWRVRVWMMRRVLFAIQRSKRGFSSLVDSIQADSFFNRSSELAAMDKLLRPQRGAAAGRLVILSGPKDSGKSALLSEFRGRQAKGQYLGVSCIADLRDVGSLTPAGVATMFKSSFIDLSTLKFKAAVGQVAGELEAELNVFKQVDGMDRLLKALTSYGLKWRHSFEAGIPTVIVDEANRLHCWATDDAGRKDLEQLLAFFVMATKQKGIMNVVMASSENLFIEWIQGFIGRQRAEVVNVGDLPEKEARKYFAGLTAPDVVPHDELWEDIYDHVGGRIGLLGQVASMTDNWEAKKAGLLEGCRTELLGALEPAALLSKKPLPPIWSKDEWLMAMKTLVEHKDGTVPYRDLCGKLSQLKVNSLIQYDLLHYRPYAVWGNDVDLPASALMPSSRLHLRAMEEVVAD